MARFHEIQAHLLLTSGKQVRVKKNRTEPSRYKETIAIHQKATYYQTEHKKAKKLKSKPKTGQKKTKLALTTPIPKTESNGLNSGAQFEIATSKSD